MAITFRDKSGRFASPKSRKKLSVFSDGTRLHGASASAVLKKFRRPSPKKVRKPRRVERPSKLGKPTKAYLKTPFGKFTKSLSGMAPREREQIYAILQIDTKFAHPSPDGFEEPPGKSVKVPFKLGRLTRRQAEKLNPDDILERAKNAGYVNPEILFIVAGRTKSQRVKVGKKVFR